MSEPKGVQLTAEQLNPFLKFWFGLEDCTGRFNPERFLGFVSDILAKTNDKWHDAVLAECTRIEAAYHPDDPERTLKELIDWHTSEAGAVADGVKAMADNYVRLTCATPAQAEKIDGDMDHIPQPYVGAITLLETIAEFGAQVKHDDGTTTPMHDLCVQFAQELRSAAANAEPLDLKDVTTLNRWATQIERMASVFNDERALLCRQAAVLLQRITYKPAQPTESVRTCNTDPHYCWSVRCNLGKKCSEQEGK